MNEQRAAEILDDTISRFLASADPVAAIAATPAEFRPYVQVLADLQAAVVPPPSEGFRERLRSRLVGQARASRPAVVAAAPRLQRAASAGAAALVLGSAMQPALAQELVQHVRATLGDSVAALLESAMREVPAPAPQEDTPGTGQPAPQSPYGGAPAAQPSSGTADLGIPGSPPTTAGARQDPALAPAAPGTPVQGPFVITGHSPASPPSPSLADGGATVNEAPAPAKSVALPAGQGQHGAGHSQPTTGTTGGPAPADGEPEVAPAGSTSAPAAEPGDTGTPPAAASAPDVNPASDPPGPAASIPANANGGNRDEALANAAESGNKNGWDKQDAESSPGNSPETPPGQANAADNGQGVGAVSSKETGKPDETGKPNDTPGNGPTNEATGTGKPGETGKPADTPGNGSSGNSGNAGGNGNGNSGKK